MKKILTFLVMLVACVSILSAQNAKFNYQAVVRDWNNNHILVQNETLNVEVKIYQGSQLVYTETLENKVTNFNGMVSFEIGAAQPEEVFELGEIQPGTTQTQDQEQSTFVNRYTFDKIDWSDASIVATFMRDNDVQVCVVETPVMAVPYALQANVDPLKITTQEIVKYIEHAEGTDVKAIYDAMVSNQSVSKAVRDSIVSYVKTQDSLAKALAIYFLHTVDPDDVEAARDTLTQSAKNAIKNIVIDYLKANKDAAYDVLGYYLTNTTVEDANALWDALKDNSQFDNIFTQVRDKAINYIKDNRDLVLGLVYYYIDNVIKVADVQGLHNHLKQNTQVYNYMLGKFNDYLDYYIGDNYLRDAECDVNLCELKNQFDDLKNNCPTISSATAVLSTSDGGTTSFLKLTVNVSGTISGNIISAGDNNVLKATLDGTTIYPSNVNANFNRWYEGTSSSQYVSNQYFSTGVEVGNTIVFELKDNNCNTTNTYTFKVVEQ